MWSRRDRVRRGPLAGHGRARSPFAPSSPAAISDLIERGLSDEAFRQATREHPLRRDRLGRCREQDRAVYEALLARPGRAWHRRRRVAIVSPFPPVASGIANYSFRLVEELATPR